MSMSMNSNLAVHCGGVRRTREALGELITPAGTGTWKPVPHAELVAELVAGLDARGVRVVREDYCTMGRDDARVLGTLDLEIAGLGTADFRFGLGLRAGNDRSCAIQLVAAARVFVCDNWCFSGSEGAVFLRRRHIPGLDLARDLPGAVGEYLERAGHFRGSIDRMRGTAIRDARAKEIIHDAFARRVLPLRLFPAVHRLYFDDDAQRDKFRERTLWSLNNSFTEAVKALKPAPQQSAGLQLGRLFGAYVSSKDHPSNFHRAILGPGPDTLLD